MQVPKFQGGGRKKLSDDQRSRKRTRNPNGKKI